MAATVVDSRLLNTVTECTSCKTQVDFIQPHSYAGQLQIRCARCRKLFPYTGTGGSSGTSSKYGASSNYPGQGNTTGGAGGSGTAAGGSATTRKGAGTDSSPIEMEYYDLLGVGPLATSDEIKKAYRRMAIKLHPDKNRDDPKAEENFKELSIAYQVLSDTNLRAIYNRQGQKQGGGGVEPAGGFQDPEVVFGTMFGGERFQDFIGTISIGKDMKDALEADREEQEFKANSNQPQMVNAQGKPVMSPEDMQRKQARDRRLSEAKAKARKERVDHMSQHMINKLSVFTETAKNEHDKAVVNAFREMCKLEGEELVKESYGWELLQSIGRTYIAKSEQHEASNSFAPLGWFHGAKQNFNLIGDTVSTLRSALELKAVFDQLQQAEGSGLSPEAIRALEEKAAEQGMRTIWKGAKLEVESVVRETCDKVLGDPAINENKKHLRAVALRIMGEAFISVKKEETEEERATRVAESKRAPPPPQPPRPADSKAPLPKRHYGPADNGHTPDVKQPWPDVKN